MGQKTNPVILRIGINKVTDSIWYTAKNYENFLLNDFAVRKYIFQKYARAGVSKVIIKRKTENVEIIIKAARPGVIIGKGGSEAEILNTEIKNLVKVNNVKVNIVEEKQIDLCSSILAEAIARQLEKRIAFRRAMKQIVGRAMRAGANGIKVQCAGRLGGAEIARTEWYREGRVPLQTIRADIDYAFTEAQTIYGKVGIKVWVYKGDIMPQKNLKEEVA